MSYVEELRAAVGERPLLLAGIGLLATDPAGRLLLQRRSDDGTWSLVGGYLEIGESPAEAVRREAQEEVGLELGEVRLYGVFAGPEFFHDYPQDGRVYSVSIVYVTRDVTGNLRADQSEVREVRFFAPRELPDDLEQTTGQILARYLQDLGRPEQAARTGADRVPAEPT